MAFDLPGSLVDRLIFQPSPGVDVRPEELGVTAEEVFLETEDEVRIHAFYLAAPGASRAMLFLHGNAGNASHRLPNAVDLHRLGTHVLLLDYRGYGRSEGPTAPACEWSCNRPAPERCRDGIWFSSRRSFRDPMA